MVQGGQQVHPPAVAVPSAAQCLAVDRDGSSSTLVRLITVGQPPTDHRSERLWVETGQGAADGGLGPR
jgi:hypothetical protein